MLRLRERLRLRLALRLLQLAQNPPSPTAWQGLLFSTAMIVDAVPARPVKPNKNVSASGGQFLTSAA